MLKYLVPLIDLSQFKQVIKIALLGAVIAGLYGLVHDQLTFTLSQEYFTKLKFKQFSYADFGWPDRAFAGLIGFLATWWVGFFSGWFIARILIDKNSSDRLYRKCFICFVCIFISALLGGIIGFLIGRFHDGNYNNWILFCRQLKVTDVPSFVRVAYIHNAGYVGGAIGLVLLAVGIFKSKIFMND